ncbi:MAG: pantetheine-phosphate adenylyltransferase [Candidatus Lambdaproteobacteria bacterium]|nr:pantetheine-phosphate adenylyltransferase [Candidatus Lambdaproteobacteria bacterium]
MHVLYPISGNPPTWGHADIVERAARVFTQVTWALAVNPTKSYLFDQAERMAMMQVYVEHFGLKNVRIDAYQGATVRFAERIGATAILKGLRNATDMQAEMEQAMGNSGMNPNIETVAMFTSPRYSIINSTLIREIAMLGEHIEAYVHPRVAEIVAGTLRDKGLIR